MERLVGLSGVYLTLFKEMCTDSPGLVDAHLSASDIYFAYNVVKNVGSLFSSSSFLNIEGDPSVLFYILSSTFKEIKANIITANGAFLAIDKSEFRNLENIGFHLHCRTYIGNSVFKSISAPNSTLISVEMQDYFDILRSNFTDIEASRLLQIKCSNGNPNEQGINNSLFENIRITGSQGGAIKVSDLSHSIIFHVNSCTFRNITSLFQFGLFILEGITNPNKTLITLSKFQDLKAPVGAFLHWEHRQPILYNNSFTSVNASIYGDILAGYPTRLVFIPYTDYTANQERHHGSVSKMQSEITIPNQKSGGSLLTLHLGVIDSIGQIVRTVDSQAIELSLLQVLSANEQPSEYSHFYTRINQFNLTLGAFSLKNVTLVGEPGKEYALTIKTPGLIDQTKPQVQDVVNSVGSVSSVLKIKFEYCAAGEAFLKTGECQLCPANTYLFHSHSKPTDCLKCPLQAECFGGEDIGPLPGYWRQDKYSLTFLSCLNSKACIGSFHPSTSPESEYNPSGSCASNYEGILCSQCKEGYIRNSRFECSKCPSFVVNLLLCVLWALFIFSFYTLIICVTRVSMTKPRSVFSIYLKILWNHTQLLILLATFRFDWPLVVKRFLTLFQAVSDAPQELFSFECLLLQASSLPRFFTTLLFHTLIPIFITILIALFWRIRIKHRTELFYTKFISSVLIFYFFIHPTISRLIFQLFNCYKLGSSLFLLQDLSEECYSSGTLHLIFSLVIGIPGILVWIIGFPALLWVVLWEKKGLLLNEKVKERFGFLYNGFANHSYYWEVVSIIRKELIAAISALLIQEGTLVQSLLLLLILFFFIFLTIKVKPYERPLLNNLELLSLLILMLTVFCGLFFLTAEDSASQYFQHGKDCKCCLKLVQLNEGQKLLLFFFILIANIVFFLRVVWALVGDTRSSMRNSCTRFYLCCCLCMNRTLLKSEIKEYKAQKTHLAIIIEINQVIQSKPFITVELQQVSKLYQRNENFQDRKKFEELLHFFASKIQKIHGFSEKDTKFVQAVSRHNPSQNSQKSINPLQDSKIEVQPFDFLTNQGIEYEFKTEQPNQPQTQNRSQIQKKKKESQPRLRSSINSIERHLENEFKLDSYSIVKELENPSSERKLFEIEYQVYEGKTPYKEVSTTKGSKNMNTGRRQLRQIVPEAQVRRDSSGDNFTKLVNEYLEKDQPKRKKSRCVEIIQECEGFDTLQQDPEVYFMSGGVHERKENQPGESRITVKNKKQSNEI